LSLHQKTEKGYNLPDISPSPNSSQSTIAHPVGMPLSSGLAPRDRSEWLVFIEGNARRGAWDKAQSLSRTLLGIWRLQSSVCQFWQGFGTGRQLIAAKPIHGNKNLCNPGLCRVDSSNGGAETLSLC
jgi:hypothetical protein